MGATIHDFENGGRSTKKAPRPHSVLQRNAMKELGVPPEVLDPRVLNVREKNNKKKNIKRGPQLIRHYSVRGETGKKS